MESVVNMRDLGATFKQLFELVPALDDATRDEVYRIRHEVYCRDLGWEPLHADGRESDEYDAHSIHCLLRRRDTGASVGCTRLILTDPDDPARPLPFEQSCHDELDRNIVDPARLPRRMVGEVSRLAVLGSFRQRKGESSSAVSITQEDFGPAEKSGGAPRFPFIPVGLYLGAAAIARRFDVEHVFVLTEPRLAHHFARIGFDIRTVGRPIEHRGTRIPSLISSSKVVAGLRPMIRPIYRVIEDAVEQAYAAQAAHAVPNARAA